MISEAGVFTIRHCPTAVGTIRLIVSPAAFLSCRIVGSMSSARNAQSTGRSYCRRIPPPRRASSSLQSPKAAAARTIIAIPMATAEPWLTAKPLQASIPWPNVWPRLSSCRCPRSNSSCATISRFIVTQVSMICSSCACADPALRSSKNGAFPRTAYLMTSAQPSRKISSGSVVRQSGSQSTSQG